MLHTIAKVVCPHCGSTTPFNVLFAKAERKKTQDANGNIRWVHGNRLRCFVSCCTCHQPAMFVLEPRNQSGALKISTNIEMHELYLNRLSAADVIFDGGTNKTRGFVISPAKEGDNIIDLYTIAEMYPQARIQRPDSNIVPAEIDQAFAELETVCAQPRYAAIACRRIIELAVNDKLGNPSANLAESIDKLMKNGLITAEVASWAHDLRLFLNQAVHESDAPTEHEANEVMNFTRMLIDLLYGFAARIERSRTG